MAIGNGASARRKSIRQSPITILGPRLAFRLLPDADNAMSR
jgi:hypothetical protein